MFSHWDTFSAAVTALPNCDWTHIEFKSTIAFNPHRGGSQEVPEYTARAMFRKFGDNWTFELRCERNGSYDDESGDSIHEFSLNSSGFVTLHHPAGKHGEAICRGVWVDSISQNAVKYLIAAALAAGALNDAASAARALNDAALAEAALFAISLAAGSLADGSLAAGQ
jgi:hypothetical protein